MSLQFFLKNKVDEAAQNDAADLLYRYGVGGLFISLLASSGLALMAATEVRGQVPYVWWAAMVAVLAMRAFDQWHFRSTRASTKLCGAHQIRRFGVGLLSTGILWAAFPLMFFTRLDQTGRAYTAIVVSGMVGGSATVLAPSKMLSFFYCTCLLLPASFLFIAIGGTENTVLGFLGCMFFVVMVLSSRLTHSAIMSAVILSRRNEALAAEMLEQRQLTDNVNTELKTAQLELSKINQSLESRIETRTADLAREIREKNQYAKDLAHLAATDSLTGILNRASILKRMGDALAEAEHSEGLLGVLFLDLNRFKEVNDEMGHYAGDRVLCTIAQRLSVVLPAEACLARWGGDEFVVMLPDIASVTFAITVATALRARIRDPIEVDLGTTMVDVTVGIAMFPEHGLTKEDLIRAADMAMYDGKQHHISIRVFEPSISRQLTERQSLERSLRMAVVNSALSLVFQPMIGVRSGRCEIVEALVRWHDPERGLMLPGEFIPLAERTGEINAIGRWVLMEACKEAATWKGFNPPAVSVNVSAAQIDYGQLASEVAQALEMSGLPAQRLQLELTESVFAGDASLINPILTDLRARGISISLDDFGTGFSCLAYMHSLPIDMIKIDRSFVESVEVSAAPIIQTIVITAQTFGLKTVAEGVETVSQARNLVEMRCDYMQGYLFSNVLSPQAMRDWLSRDCPDGKISSMLWDQIVAPAARSLSATI